MRLRFCFYQRFEGGFVFGYAGVGFACECFFEDLLPSFHVGAYVVEGFSVDLDVLRRVGWTVEDGVEGYVSAQPMGKEQAADDAFMHYVEPSSVV